MDALEVDIELARGDFRLCVRESFTLAGTTAIFGASGSGKTSLLRVIAGLEPAARGRIALRGREWLGDAGSIPAERRAIGYVFQDARLFAHLDVRGNLQFPVRHGKRRGNVSLDAIVAALGLADLLARYPASLSGGEQQRVAIGRALLADPVLLLMDEPLSSLDIARKRELLPLIRELATRFGVPVFYVTHDVDELAFLADRVVMLAGGRNVASGSAREILARADFARLSEIDDPGSILEAQIESQTGELSIVALAAGRIRLPRIPGAPGTAVALRVRARDVVLATVEPVGISIRNRLNATVRELQPRDDGLVTVWLQTGEQALAARITCEAAEELALAPGMAVFALIKSVALDTFGRG
jgi:molybdate transport system ATP-binding protein